MVTDVGGRVLCGWEALDFVSMVCSARRSSGAGTHIFHVGNVWEKFGMVRPTVFGSGPPGSCVFTVQCAGTSASFLSCIL